MQFFETVMGKKFFEVQVPKLTKALERIADALEDIAEQKESKDKEDGTE